MKREENKKSELLKRLGELTSIQWPDLPEIEDISREIKALEEKNTGLQVEWHRIYKRAGKPQAGENQADVLPCSRRKF